MLTQGEILQRARSLIQEAPTVPLLQAEVDYARVFDLALAQYGSDKPRRRVVHHTVSASAFRFVLSGAGSLAGLTGLDAWVDGRSTLLAVYHPYDVAAAGNAPLEPEAWRVIEEPGLTILELLELTPSSGVLRLEFLTPPRLDAIAATVPAPSAPTAAVVASAGNLSAGVYQYAAVHRTANGATTPSATVSVTVTTPGTAGKVALGLSVPTVEGVTGVDLYRTTAGGSTLKFLAALDSPTLDSYTDNLADGALGADAPATNTAGGLSSVPASHEQALVVLTASMLAQAVALRYVQNTGTSSLPSDVVNRSSQADDMARRARELRDTYARILGLPTGSASGSGAGAGSTVAPAGAVLEFDLETQHDAGFIFKRRRFR